MLLNHHNFLDAAYEREVVQRVSVFPMHWWCVLFILPVLMAGALSPDDGCGFNTTVVASVNPVGEHTRQNYSSSIVDTGLIISPCSLLSFLRVGINLGQL